MRTTLVVITFLLFITGCDLKRDYPEYELPTDSTYNFIFISDFGRNGFENQREVAGMMAEVAPRISNRFYVTGGDNFQVSGVQSVHDPLWQSSFEDIYTHPSSHSEWYPALGNHDHGGNIQAQTDYSRISRRWKMPAAYYTLVKRRDSISIRLVILDTYSIVEGYSDPDERYTAESAGRQISWADSVLSVSQEDWTIVVGHHPVYSAHPTRRNTEELVEHLVPVLNKHKVDFFLGAHDHIFQHLKDSSEVTDYFVNTAGSSVRNEAYNEMTVFTASSPGFIICSAAKRELSVYFINIEGKPIYKYTRKKSL